MRIVFSEVERPAQTWERFNTVAFDFLNCRDQGEIRAIAPKQL